MDEQAIKHAFQLIDQGHIEEGGPALVSQLGYAREEDGWGWLYSCVKTDAQRIYCIRRILQINPRHQKAQDALVEIKLKEAKAISQFDAQDVEEIVHRLDEQQLEAIPMGHQEISVYNNSDKEQLTEAEIDGQYRQGLLPEFEAVGSRGDTVINKSDILVPRKKKLNVKKKSKKPKQKMSDEELEKALKSTEPHVFNPKIYHTIPTDADENLFTRNKKTGGSYPEIASGMYGRRLVIGGVPITSSDYPHCIEVHRIPHKSYCHNCEFFSIIDCPIRRDITILRDAITLFAHHKRYAQEFEERKQIIIETIFTELKAHGRPLHYEVVSRILHDRHPNLKLNSRKVLQYMHWHPEKFENIDRGVYQAK
jgi:hypothetical protein